MKNYRIVLTVLCFVFACIIHANALDSSCAAYLTMEPFSMNAGEEKIVYIDMENPNDLICGLSFELKLPDGITVKTTDSGQRYIQRVADRVVTVTDESGTTYSHSFQSSVKSDGTIVITYLSNNNTLFTGTTGHLIKLTLVAAASMTPGDYCIYLNKVALAHRDASAVHPDDRSVNVTIASDSARGDIDGDKVVSVCDLAALISYLNGVTPSEFNLVEADVNGDNVIDEKDIEVLADKILNNK